MRRELSRIAAILAFPLLLLSVVLGAWLFREEIGALFDNLDTVRAQVRELGAVGVLYAIGVQVLQVVVFIIPGETVQIAAGFIYGIAGGVAVSVGGIVIGSAVNFAVGRLLGRPFVDAIVPARHRETFDEVLERRSTRVAYLLLFVVPGIPKDILGYLGGAAGREAMPFVTFLTYSMLGRMPGIIGSAIIGHAAGSGYPVVAVTLLSVAAVVAMIALFNRRAIIGWVTDRS